MTAICKDSIYEHICNLEQENINCLGIVKREESIDIDGIEFEQSTSLLHESTGAMVWQGSIELLKILKNTSLGNLIKNKKVLELGCGTGVLARLLSPLTAEYYATDQKPLLKLARRNNEGGTVLVKEFDWELHDWTGEQVDCIIACDTIYNEYLVPFLVEAIKSVRGAQNIPTILAIQVRESHMLTQAFDCLLSHFKIVHHCTNNGVAVYTLDSGEGSQSYQ